MMAPTMSQAGWFRLIMSEEGRKLKQVVVGWAAWVRQSEMRARLVEQRNAGDPGKGMPMSAEMRFRQRDRNAESDES